MRATAFGCEQHGYADPPVQPGGGCRATDFTISGSSDSVVVNTVITAYFGRVQLTGTGSTECASSLADGGDFVLTATGEAPNGGTLDCDALDGTYSRVGTVAAVRTSGTCLVNSFPADVEFIAEGATRNLSARQAETAATPERRPRAPSRADRERLEGACKDQVDNAPLSGDIKNDPRRFARRRQATGTRSAKRASRSARSSSNRPCRQDRRVRRRSTPASKPASAATFRPTRAKGR